MELVKTEVEEKTFRPVNDEYRPFGFSICRELLHEHIEVPLVARLFALPQRKRILVVGCGAGSTLAKLAQFCRPQRLVGIDIDARSLKCAQTRLQRYRISAELYQQDVRCTAFPEESFDAVIDFGTGYHINRKVKALREVARLLVTGGLYVAETRLAQRLAHPIRSRRQTLPLHLVPELRPHRFRLFWAAYEKV